MELRTAHPSPQIKIRATPSRLDLHQHLLGPIPILPPSYVGIHRVAFEAKTYQCLI